MRPQEREDYLCRRAGEFLPDLGAQCRLLGEGRWLPLHPTTVAKLLEREFQNFTTTKMGECWRITCPDGTVLEAQWPAGIDRPS
jgi:hypothetical protein